MPDEVGKASAHIMNSDAWDGDRHDGQMGSVQCEGRAVMGKGSMPQPLPHGNQKQNAKHISTFWGQIVQRKGQQSGHSTIPDQGWALISCSTGPSSDLGSEGWDGKKVKIP